MDILKSLGNIIIGIIVAIVMGSVMFSIVVLGSFLFSFAFAGIIILICMAAIVSLFTDDTVKEENKITKEE